jgi:lipopolysaccharide biosynthesis protein
MIGLADIEEHIKPLSKVEKEQLIRDIQAMLKEQETPVIEGPKFHRFWDFDEMATVAEKLKAYEATLTGPTRLDESQLIYMEGCDE